MTDDDLVPLHDGSESGGFDVVLRGYDRRQVEDYVDRVEVALADADRQHAEDGERLTSLEHQVTALQAQLTEAEHRAAGLPEPASRLTERLATMLRLAEEEAEQIVEQARERAAASMSERTADLDRREAQVSGAADAAERTRLDAQRDAEELRHRARQEAQTLVDEARAQADQLVAAATEQADTKRRTAEEDVAILHERGHARDAERVAAAQAKVEELALQRDTIAAQLQALRETLSAAMQPLHATSPSAVPPSPQQPQQG